MNTEHPDSTPPGTTYPDTTARDLEDAAAVIAVIAALTANTAGPQAEPPRSVWGSPARLLGALAPGGHTWWSSGAAR